MSDEASTILLMMATLSLVWIVPNVWRANRDARRDERRAREYGQHGINEVPVRRTSEPETDIPNRAEPEQGFVDDRPGPVEPPDDLALPPAGPKRLR